MCMNCFYNRVQKRHHEKKTFFFIYISAFWIPPAIPYRCSMMKSIHRPLGGDRFVEAEIWPHEYLISPIEISVNWSGS